MKRLVPCLLLLPFLTSCEMAQPEYYDAGYYHSVPPRAEVYGFDERPHDYRHSRHRHRHQDHKHAKVQTNRGKMHGRSQSNVQYGHDKNHGQVVVINSGQKNVHEHDEKKGHVTKRPSESGANVIIHSN